MCGRVFIKSTIGELVRAFAFANPGDVERLGNVLPRWNGAPRQTYPIIVLEELKTGMAGFTSAAWGLVPSWTKETVPGRPPPINARAETVATNGMFRRAYQSRRCLIPVDGYFEWKDILGTGKDKQPYAIAMRDGSPFALAGIYEDWPNPATGEMVRTFCVITTEANEMMTAIHDRMPVIIDPADYERWLGGEADPQDLLGPFPSERMTMWPIGRSVGSPCRCTAGAASDNHSQPSRSRP